MYRSGRYLHVIAQGVVFHVAPLGALDEGRGLEVVRDFATANGADRLEKPSTPLVESGVAAGRDLTTAKGDASVVDRSSGRLPGRCGRTLGQERDKRNEEWIEHHSA